MKPSEISKDKKAALIYWNNYLALLQAFSNDPTKRLQMYEALLKYQFTGEKPDWPNDAVMQAFWTAFEPGVTAAMERYEKAVENGKKGAEFGKMGGRPRKGETKEEYQARKAAETSDEKDE